MRNHTENHGIEGMSGMSCGSLKSKQNKPLPWAKNRREYLPQMYAMYNVTPNHKQHLTGAAGGAGRPPHKNLDLGNPV